MANGIQLGSAAELNSICRLLYQKFFFSERVSHFSIKRKNYWIWIARCEVRKAMPEAAELRFRHHSPGRLHVPLGSSFALLIVSHKFISSGKRQLRGYPIFIAKIVKWLVFLIAIFHAVPIHDIGIDLSRLDPPPAIFFFARDSVSSLKRLVV